MMAPINLAGSSIDTRPLVACMGPCGRQVTKASATQVKGGWLCHYCLRRRAKATK